jgi:beta-glucosidase
MVTYNHFTAPRWLAHRGGWNAPDAADRFGRYAERVTAHLGDLVPWVCTINEPNVISLLIHTGVAPAAASDDQDAVADLAGIATPHEAPTSPSPAISAWPSPDLETMARMHRRAVEAVKSGPGDAKVGWTLALIDLQPVEGGEERCVEARKAGELDWLDVSRDDDFVGVQTYTRRQFGERGGLAPPEGAPVSQTGWELYPEALGHTVRLATEHAGVPVMVTENGLATDDDAQRLDYTRRALEGLGSCVADGVDVRGYLHWTLLDNFEWVSGFAMTFGLIAFDHTTFARTVKPTAHWLGEVARANALP